MENSKKGKMPEQIAALPKNQRAKALLHLAVLDRAMMQAKPVQQSSRNSQHKIIMKTADL